MELPKIVPSEENIVAEIEEVEEEPEPMPVVQEKEYVRKLKNLRKKLQFQ